MDQGGGQGDPRHQAPPRRADPRQGDRGRDRSPAARVEHPVHPGPGQRPACSRAGRPSWPARTTARSRSPSRPARGTCSSSGRPATTSSARSAPTSSPTIGPAGQRYHGHAIIPYEVKAGDPPHEVAAALRPGVTIKGRVEGPDGQTVTDGFILTTLHIEPFNPSWRGDYQVPVRDGRFELHGLDPEGSTRIHVLDPEHEWGATVEVSGKQAGEDLTIRLQPCGQAKARFVGPDGKPVAKHRAALRVRRHARPEPATTGRQPGSGRAGGRRRLHRQRRPQALLERPAHRRRGPHHPGLPDPRRPVPDHRLLDRQRPGQGAPGPQGLHRQARRDARPGRYPDREARD